MAKTQTKKACHKEQKRIIEIKPALFVVDVQNGFMSPGGSYDKMKYNIKEYRKIIEPLKQTIRQVRTLKIPILFSKAVREASGIDTTDHLHKILPTKRRERIRRNPLCVRDSWESDFIEEVKVDPKKDYVIEKRRDSAFRGTELEIWLNALKIDTLIFTGIDTAVCVESTLRDAFNIGYDVILLSDVTSSLTPQFYDTSLAEVREHFGLVMPSKDVFSHLKKQGDKFIFVLTD